MKAVKCADDGAPGPGPRLFERLTVGAAHRRLAHHAKRAYQGQRVNPRLLVFVICHLIYSLKLKAVGAGREESGGVKATRNPRALFVILNLKDF